jgi:ATP-binding protein involved in chromosome partitioning
MALPTSAEISSALADVLDPEIRRPLTELGMVKSVDVGNDGLVRVGIFLTIAGCPMRATLESDVRAAVQPLSGVSSVVVTFDVMGEMQRSELVSLLRPPESSGVVPFETVGSLTRVYAVASGKGGVGKSSVTANLAVAMASEGVKVGVLDADVYGFSAPRMLGVTQAATRIDGMLLPPVSHGVKVISIGMFLGEEQSVMWRGPMLHKALQQFLVDVFWGDLDVLLLDMPPGTGDVALSVARLLPSAEILVVTTPQVAASEVAERAGLIGKQTGQSVAGVIENMSWMDLPDGSRIEPFGSGGGRAVADTLTERLGTPVPLLVQIPLDPRLREAGDAGVPLVLATPEAPAARALRSAAHGLAYRALGLSGRRLGLTPASPGPA